MTWFKIDTDIVENDSMNYAFSISPFAAHAMLWAFTRAAKKQCATFDAERYHIAGGARKLGIEPEQMREGIDALAEVGFLAINEDRIEIANWEKHQSEYMRRQQRTKALGTGPDTHSDAGDPPTTASGGAKPHQKQSNKSTRAGGSNSFPQEAIDIESTWKAFRKKYQARMSGSDASFPQGLKNLVKMQKVTKHPWDILLRCVERYFEEVEVKDNHGFLYAFGNFWGRQEYYKGFLEEDWTAPEATQFRRSGESQKTRGLTEIPDWDKINAERGDGPDDVELYLAELDAKTALANGTTKEVD
ncbi:MAG: hypothetical protein JRE40_02350 [Deltaproteobacteria bacterium]|nr:hypothetical protein [Deltaproteobacteria bacterium]